MAEGGVRHCDPTPVTRNPPSCDRPEERGKRVRPPLAWHYWNILPDVPPPNMRRKAASLIFNPVAGQGDPEADLALILSFLEPVFDLELCVTTPEIDADVLAHKALAAGAELLIASGGDGTLSAVAAATIGTGVPVGVISRGTANSFATALGIPVPIELACETIVAGGTRTVDTARCNGQPMVLLAGIGLEAQMVARADREAKNWLGALAYIVAGFQEMTALQPFQVQVEAPGILASGMATAITVANAAPPTSVFAQGCGAVIPDDGLLDVTFFTSERTTTAIAAAFDMFQAAIRAEASVHPEVGHVLVPWIRILTDPPQLISLDGEVIGETPLEVVCLPGSLRVFVPVELPVLPLS